jgi:pimeloyl-ACP methyl ester carboxylesterase
MDGLGATGAARDGWRPLLARRWPGRWLAPDLPGHGGSRPLPGCTFDTLAAAVAGLASGGARAVVLGHPPGGVVALALASGRFSVPVQAVTGLGIKVTWAAGELDRAQAAARRPPAWFTSREEAAARYLRIPGLAGHGPGRVRRRGAGHGAIATFTSRFRGNVYRLRIAYEHPVMPLCGVTHCGR